MNSNLLLSLWVYLFSAALSSVAAPGFDVTLIPIEQRGISDKAAVQRTARALTIALNSINTEGESIFILRPQHINGDTARIDFEALKIAGFTDELVQTISQVDPAVSCNGITRSSFLIHQLTGGTFYQARVNRDFPYLKEFKKKWGLADEGTLLGSGVGAITSTTQDKSRLHLFRTNKGNLFRIQYAKGTENEESEFRVEAERWIFPLKNGMKGEVWFNALGARQEKGPAWLKTQGSDVEVLPPLESYFPWSPYLIRGLSHELGTTTRELGEITAQEDANNFGLFSKWIPGLPPENNPSSAQFDQWITQTNNSFSVPVTPDLAAKEFGVSVDASRRVIGKSMERMDFENRFCALRGAAVQADGVGARRSIATEKPSKKR